MAFKAIVFVLVTGIAWQSVLPGMAAAEGLAAGGGVRALTRAARALNAAGAIDWSTAVCDGSHIRALLGPLTGHSPVDRGRAGQSTAC